MSVFVDDAYLLKDGKKGTLKLSHMIADTSEELDQMAIKIGINPKYRKGNHYDVSLSKRREALAQGALEISWRECFKKAMSG